MRRDPEEEDRRSVRLRDHDYGRPGPYFLTICSFQRRHLFSRVVDGKVELTPLGLIIREEWQRSVALRPELKLDAFVVMPNHIHGIVWIRERTLSRREPDGYAWSRGLPTRKPRTISSFVAGFKGAVTARAAAVVWQRGFHEHVIRTGRRLDVIRRYIRMNPLMWRRDSEFRM